MTRYGLLGFPLHHSLSPVMHNAAFAALGIPAQYELFEHPADRVEGFLRGLAREGISGINVTIPHKERVLALMTGLSDDARVIGAVNTVRVTGEGLQGYNTDCLGFIRDLRESLHFECTGRSAAIIGAGGASRAVAAGLCREGISRLAIFDVDAKKLTHLTVHLGAHFPKVKISAAGTVHDLAGGEPDLLVNASPAGMKPGDPLPVPESLLSPGQAVYDLIYNPQTTELVRCARARGLAAANGLGMLLYQGAEAFTLWTGREAPVEVMRAALHNALEERS